MRLRGQLKDRIRSLWGYRTIRRIRPEFDADFYRSRYEDVKKSEIDPVAHYVRIGWRELRDPRRDFNTASYLRRYLDVAISGMNPFYHYIVYGRGEGRRADDSVAADEASRDPNYPNYLKSRAAHLLQDRTFPTDAETAERIMVILIPEHNEMSGGIYSFFSIAKAAYALRHKHNYRVLLMTRPNRLDETYLRQRNFRNSEDVFRFAQIVRCRRAETVYLHIPEYAAAGFVESLDRETYIYLRSRERLYINILNQKVGLMPEPEALQDLRTLASELTQSAAHHAYCGQAFADRYDLPMLLLPAYTDLSQYEPIPFEEKEALVIYSPDDASYRDDVLEALSKGLPDYTLREIRNITFDRYMELATRCRFSITFGEGFDGYLAQPIYQNGLGFAVYNDDFFPSRDFLAFANIFESGDAMAAGIVARIRELERNPDLYRRTNRAMMDVYNKLYSREDYLRRVDMLIQRQFEFHPLHLSRSPSAIRL